MSQHRLVAYEVADWHTERSRDLDHDLKSRVPVSVLDLRNVGRVHRGALSQRPLRQPEPLTFLSDATSERALRRRCPLLPRGHVRSLFRRLLPPRSRRFAAMPA